MIHKVGLWLQLRWWDNKAFMIKRYCYVFWGMLSYLHVCMVSRDRNRVAWKTYLRQVWLRCRVMKSKPDMIVTPNCSIFSGCLWHIETFGRKLYTVSICSFRYIGLSSTNTVLIFDKLGFLLCLHTQSIRKNLPKIVSNYQFYFAFQTSLRLLDFSG